MTEQEIRQETVGLEIGETANITEFATITRLGRTCWEIEQLGSSHRYRSLNTVLPAITAIMKEAERQDTLYYFDLLTASILADAETLRQRLMEYDITDADHKAYYKICSAVEQIRKIVL